MLHVKKLAHSCQSVLLLSVAGCMYHVVTRMIDCTIGLLGCQLFSPTTCLHVLGCAALPSRMRVPCLPAEFCDEGSLAEAIDRRFFMLRNAIPRAQNGPASGGGVADFVGSDRNAQQHRCARPFICMHARIHTCMQVRCVVEVWYVYWQTYQRRGIRHALHPERWQGSCMTREKYEQGLQAPHRACCPCTIRIHICRNG